MLRSKSEQLIAGGMSACIVDVFELIKIDKEHGASRPLFFMGCDLGIKFRNQSVSGIETCQTIVICEMPQVLFTLLQRQERVAERRNDRLGFFVRR